MPNLYEIVKSIHVITAIFSISGFVLRGVWMIKSSAKLHHPWVKMLPHINDTILLLSAIVLVIMTTQYPIYAGWINAKLVALLIYIVFGMIALKRGKTKRIRIIAWIFAIVVFAYILAVAQSKTAFII